MILDTNGLSAMADGDLKLAPLLQQASELAVLVIDERTAGLYAEIRRELKRSGHPIPENDIWIAALARQHNFPLLTRDQHFDFVPGLKRLHW